MGKRCKKCGREMKRRYTFSSKGIYKTYCCPYCFYVGRSTKSNIKDLFEDKDFFAKEGMNG